MNDKHTILKRKFAQNKNMFNFPGNPKIFTKARTSKTKIINTFQPS